MNIAWAVLLLAIMLGCWFVTLLSLPGNWLMTLAAVAYVLLVPADSPAAIGWGVVIALVVLAGVGELLEFGAGALGVAKAGGSRRGAALALIGSLLGAFLGLFLGVPIPVVGPIIGALLLASLGAFGGAMLGERWKGRDVNDSARIGHAAFWGRLLGTVAKTALGGVMIGVTLVAMVL